MRGGHRLATITSIVAALNLILAKAATAQVTTDDVVAGLNTASRCGELVDELARSPEANRVDGLDEGLAEVERELEALGSEVTAT